MPEVYYTPEPSPGRHSTGECPAEQQPCPMPPSPAEPPGLRWGLAGRATCLFPAGSESWLEDAEILSTGEAEAADVQVSEGSCSPSSSTPQPVLVLFAVSLWSLSLIPCCAAPVGASGSRVGDTPCVLHVGEGCDHPLWGIAYGFLVQSYQHSGAGAASEQSGVSLCCPWAFWAASLCSSASKGSPWHKAFVTRVFLSICCSFGVPGPFPHC